MCKEERILKAYKFRIYPNQEQETLLLKTAGLGRLYYNICVSQRSVDHKWQIGSYKKVFEECKPEALDWCKEVDSAALAAYWNDIKVAFKNFFEQDKMSLPKYKSKKTAKIGITYTSAAIPKFVDGKLYLTKKLGPIEGKFHRFAEGKLRHVTFSQTKTGKWFVSICCDAKPIEKNKNGKVIGIDWNCRDDCFLTLSNGTKAKCPRFLREKEKQLAHYQKQMSKRFVKGVEIQSNNYYKSKYKVAKLHEKVAWQREDWLHKLSRDLCNKYETVFVENINLQTMSSELKHGKVISDQGFGMLRTMIAYKGNLVKVPAKNTSKMCSNCNYVNPKVVLGVEQWKCPICGETHDRDINAARNILRKGIVGRELSEIRNACGGPRSSVKQESPNSLQVTA